MWIIPRSLDYLCSQDQDVLNLELNLLAPEVEFWVMSRKILSPQPLSWRGWRWCPVCINIINLDQVNLDAIYQTDHEDFVQPDWLIIVQGYPDGMEHLKQSLIKRLDNYESSSFCH